MFNLFTRNGFAFIFCAILFNIAYSQETQVIQAITAQDTCKTAELEPAKKICTDRSVHTYLRENFQQVVGQNPELAGVTCNWDLPITPPKGIFSQEPKYRITCENQNLMNKVLVGWIGDLKFMQSNIVLGNHLLYLRGKKEDAKINCNESRSYSNITNAVMGSNCTLTISPSGQSVSFSVVYTKNQTVTDRKLFVAVMSVEPQKTEDLERYLLGSLAK